MIIPVENLESNFGVKKELIKTFSPEFLNIIDDIVIFNSLNQKDIRKIVDIELEFLITRVEKLGYKISISENAKDFLSEKGFDIKYGARPLNRAIQKHVEDLIAEHVVDNSIKEGDYIEVNLNENGKALILKINQKTEASS